MSDDDIVFTGEDNSRRDMEEAAHLEQFRNARAVARRRWKVAGVDVSDADIARLDCTLDGGWLADSTVHAAGQLLMRIAAIRHRPRPYLVMTPLFWKKWQNGSPHAEVAAWGHEAHGGTRQNLEQIGRVAYPINEHRSHWALITVDYGTKKVEYFNSLAYTERYADARFRSILRYIYWQSKGVRDRKGGWLKKPFKYDCREWKLELVREPAQDNSHDCGVMVYLRLKQLLLERDGLIDDDDERNPTREIRAEIRHLLEHDGELPEGFDVPLV